MIPCVERVAFSALANSCNNFDPSLKIGEGATGEVFRTTQRDFAIKRLSLQEGATPEAKAALSRAFEAELATLSSYCHPRLVRLVSYAKEDNPSTRFPYVLCFEFLEEGSLADHLMGPNGEAPKLAGPPLTPLERVDAALGTSAALAYLHGLPDTDGGGALVGGAAEVFVKRP